MRAGHWLNRAILSLIILIVNMGCYNFYFYELFWGSWPKIYSRRLYYVTTAFFLLFVLADELFKYKDDTHYQINLVCKATVIVNFILFALILYGVFNNPILYLYLLNGSIFAISVIILCSGIKYGSF